MAISNFISIPLKAASVLNFIVRAGIVATSIVFKNKWCAAVGGLGIVSSIVQSSAYASPWIIVKTI